MLSLVEKTGRLEALPSPAQIESIAEGSDEQTYILDMLASILPTSDLEERHVGKGYRWVYAGTWRHGNGEVYHRMSHAGRQASLLPLPGHARECYGRVNINIPANRGGPR
jgi:hypothetical protein